MAGREEARQRGVLGERQNPALGEELLRLIECLQCAIRREAQLVDAFLAQLCQRRHVLARRKRARERPSGRVAAADPERDLLAAQIIAQLPRGSGRRRPGALGDLVTLDEEQPHRAVELVVADEHEVVEELAENLLR